jgi:signal transduction histidine kinase
MKLLLNSLRLRLTLFISVIVILPMLIAILLISFESIQILQNNAKEKLALQATLLANNVTMWNNEMERVLQNLSTQPDIVSMKPNKQKLVLQKTVSIYKSIYLLSTIGLDGINLARSDNEKPKDYSDRTYFKEIVAGKNLASQILISRTTGQPAIVFGGSIRNKRGQLVGMVTLGTELTMVTEQTKAVKLGQTGTALVIEATGKVLAEPEQKQVSNLKNLSHYSPVKELLSGHNGAFAFTDENGVKWLSHLILLENGWGVIVQQQEQEVLQKVYSFWQFALTVVLIVLGVISVMTWVIASGLSRPLEEVTRAAIAVSNGKLNQMILIHRTDELGILVKAFNSMAKQLQESFAILDARNTELTKLNLEKNEFLGIAAHDLKNPLSAILGLADLITTDFDSLLKEEVVDYAKGIAVSAEQMFGLIVNLLDVNKIESGQFNLVLKPTELRPLVQVVVNNYQERAKAKNLALHFQPQEIPLTVLVDLNITRQVLDNLISNAIKYSPPGKSVYVRLLQTGPVVSCEIQDEGPGLSDTDQQKLFGKFARLTAQPTGGEHSTGLGLFIVKKLVTAMNGKVWCESELGKGATFVVEFSIPSISSDSLII